MVGDLQAPQQVIDNADVAQRGLDMFSVTQHGFGNDLGPRCGHEATQAGSGAHRHHLVCKAMREVLLKHFTTFRELKRIGGGLARAQLALQLVGQESVDAIQPALEGGGRRRRCAADLFDHGGAQREQFGQARVVSLGMAVA